MYFIHCSYFIYSVLYSRMYTQKEDKCIIKYLSNLSDSKMIYSCSQVARLLNRKPTSVWNRFQKLKEKYNLNKKVSIINKSNINKHKNRTKNENRNVKSTKKLFKNRIRENGLNITIFLRHFYT
jgi:hypothetical protein